MNSAKMESSMRARLWHVGAGAVVGTLVGCSDSLGTVCTDEARPGIMVTVRDSVTTASVSRARVVARTATIADTSEESPNGVYPLVYEKAGTYTVTVEQAGYRTWTRANVEVTRDECHVKTVSLTALLQPGG